MLGAIWTRLRSAPLSSAENLAALLVIGICIAWIGCMSLSRTYLQTNIETDFLYTFWSEARLFLEAKPMLVRFHPPGYPILLGTVYRFTGDAMRSGLIISWLSACIALVGSYLLYRRIMGPIVGIAALAALTASLPFLELSAMATSDVFFFAMWTCALLVASHALDANRGPVWLAAGLLAGIVILCRTNGIVIGILVFAPFMLAKRFGEGLRNAAVVVAGIAAPIAVWAAYAHAVGSPVIPTKNFANLALTYFSDGNRHSGEAMVKIEQQFHTLWDVISYDPALMLRTYAIDFAHLPMRLITDLTWIVYALVGIAGVLVWLWQRWRDPQVLLIVITALAAILFLNLKVYETRYFLYLVPLLGAATGYVLREWITMNQEAADGCLVHARLMSLLIAGFTALSCVALWVTGTRAVERVEDEAINAQMAEALPVLARTPPGSTLMARKPNLAFHAARRSVWMPEAQTPRELCNALQQPPASAHYLFVGIVERKRRADMAAWLEQDPPPDWLELVASGPGGRDRGWRLFKLSPNAECSTAASEVFPPRR